MSSSWKLVEAVVESPGSTPSDSKHHNADKNNSKDKSRKVGNDKPRNQNKIKDYKQDPQAKEQFLNMACQQMWEFSIKINVYSIWWWSNVLVDLVVFRELIFSEENLCMDTFIRSYMDEAGYVPLSVVCSYQNVACFGFTVDEILEKLPSLTSNRFEFDTVHQTMKLAEKWNMVRM